MKYAFTNFELDSDKFELIREGDLVVLEPQVLSLLVLLVENSDRMVTKAEIVDKIWDGRAISDSSIGSRVKLARQAVEDSGSEQHTIRTIYGLGFRFVAEVQRVSTVDGAPITVMETPPLQQSPLKLDGQSKPSIAVLPFQLLNSSNEFDTMADAIPHELIQALSQMRWLLVIARGSTFQFRSPDPDVRKIGQVLNVRYCLSGSVELSAREVAITVELSDTKDSGVVWSERFSSPLEGVHEIRAAIVARVVSSLEIYIPMNEARGARMNAPENLSAWSNYHLGLQYMYRFTKDDNTKATALFERAIVQEPEFARAYAGLSFTRFQDAFVKYSQTQDVSAQQARRFAERSIELDPYDPFANLTMGRSYWLAGEVENSIDWLDRAISLNPNYAQGAYSRGFADMICGRTDNARRNVDDSFLLSPLDPLLYAMHGTRAFTFISEGNYEEAAAWAEKGARAPGAHYLIAMIAMIAHSLNGNAEKAMFWERNVRQRQPGACQRDFFYSFPLSDPKTKAQISTVLKQFGL